MDDPPPAGCEICGEGPVEKVLHPVPVFFKGSGFYSTDYGRKKRKPEAAEGDAATKPDDGKKPEKPDKKTAETS
jgi:predicted nucleic acid-binding Zn ribbon protein